MICSTGIAGGVLVISDSSCASDLPAAGPAVLLVGIPGEPDPPLEVGGGSGPCCWARATGSSDAAENKSTTADAECKNHARYALRRGGSCERKLMPVGTLLEKCGLKG